MEFKEFQNHWAPWDSMFGYFLSPSLPTNGFLQLFWKFPNFKFEIFNPPPHPGEGGSHYVMMMMNCNCGMVEFPLRTTVRDSRHRKYATGCMQDLNLHII